MIYKGDLVDSFGGVPQDAKRVEQFFEKAKSLASGQAGSPEAEEPQADVDGLQIEKHNEGVGPLVPRGAKVKVHYTCKLTDGTVFDSSTSRDPLEFVVGVGQVIKGWDEGIIQLQKG